MKMSVQQVQYATVTVATYIPTNEVLMVSQDQEKVLDFYARMEDVVFSLHYAKVGNQRLTVQELNSGEFRLKGYVLRAGAKIKDL